MTIRLEHEVTYARLERDAQRLVKANDDLKRAALEAQARAREVRLAAEEATRAAEALRRPFRRGG